MPIRTRPPRRAAALSAALATLILGACTIGAPTGTPPITPGTSAAPRDVNVIARDYAYVPSVVDLVPGETVRLHVINGGLETHEAILGDLASQLEWEAAENATVGHPPGPTPFVPDPPGFAGVRVVVGSGQRVDITWTVPSGAAIIAAGWFVGCHIPGHWQKGMVVPIRFVDAAGHPLASTPVVPSPTGPGAAG